MQTQEHTYRRNFIGLLLGLALLTIPFSGKAQAVISPVSSSFCSNYATDGPTPYWILLNTISVAETATSDFGNTAGPYTITITATAPTGWEFNPAHSPLVEFPSGGNNTGITIITYTSTTLTFSLSGANNNLSDGFTIEGVQVRPTSTSSAAGNITLSFTGVMTGLSGGETLATVSTFAPSSGTVITPFMGASATTICAGDNVDFSATPMGGIDPYYQWQINGDNVTGATSSTYSTTALADGDDISVILYDHACITTPTVTATAATDMTVKPLPTAITGIAAICSDGTTTLNSTPASGTWSSSFHTVATIDASTGVVDPVEPGNAIISYEATNGCFATIELTVNPRPSPIDGNQEVCQGSTETLSNDDAGGIWESSATSVATIGTDGTVTGVLSGITLISYTFTSTGCRRVETFTVNAIPEAITGPTSVCAMGTTTLTSTTTGGTWTSSNTGAGTIDASTGAATGVAAGSTTVTYEAGTHGCYVTRGLTVNPLPAATAGTMSVCATGTQTLSNTGGGTWQSSATGVATVGTSGTVTGVMAGTANITYTLATGCYTTNEFTVNALPAVFNVTGTGAYCAGSAGLPVGLSNTAIGHTYDLYDGSTLVGSINGDGSAAAFGTYTTAATYTATATNTSTGCMNNMTGDATLTITPLSTPAVSIANSPDDTVCAGTAVTFTANPVNGGAGPLYTWSVNGTASGTGATFNYTPANGDVVSVVLTTNVVCPSTPTANDDFAMVVYANETPAVTISTGVTTICQYTPVTFSVATSAHGGTAPVYTWYKGTVSTGITGTSYTYQPADNDVISVKLNSNYRCPTANNVASNNISMNVDSVFIPAVAITANTGLEIAPGESVTFTTKVTKAGTATPLYQWYLNKVAINNATSATYTSSTLANNDSVTVRVRAAGVCSDATHTFNSVKMKVTTGFVHTTLDAADIQLVPNPNSGIFYVRGALNTYTDTDVLLEVTNMMGQVVYTNRITAQGGNIDTQVQPNNTLASGMYLLTLRTGVERRAFRFVVKQ